MDREEHDRLFERGRSAAIAWLDEHRVSEKVTWDDGLELWLAVLVGPSEIRHIIPCTFYPDEEMTQEEGPALGPDGEPRMLISCWEPLDHGVLESGNGFAVYVEKHYQDADGDPRQLWIPW